jgi:large subunit ribosomal protein L21
LLTFVFFLLSFFFLFCLLRATMLRSANPAIAKALQPLLEGPKFAVVYCGNHQYKVAPGDVIAVQRLRAPIGSQITLKKVLMVGGPRFTAIGRPLLEHVRVTADVEEQKRMRNVVSLFTTAGRRRMRWVDAQHAATILRIREVIYEPTVVGELDKYDGVVLKEFTAEKHPNPVFNANDGYDLHYKKDWDKVEKAAAFLEIMSDEATATAAAADTTPGGK